jgi:hypothetical protein
MWLSHGSEHVPMASPPVGVTLPLDETVTSPWKGECATAFFSFFIPVDSGLLRQTQHFLPSYVSNHQGFIFDRRLSLPDLSVPNAFQH